MPQVPQVPVVALSRYEAISDITIDAQNAEYTLPTLGGLLPSDRFLWGLRLLFEGRATMPASGNPTGVTADERRAFIENVIVEGYHRLRGAQETFINLRGPELFQLNRIYTGREPVSTPSSLTLTASATNDIRFAIDIPFVPMNVPWRAAMGWLLDAPNYDSLKLRVRVGDVNSIFTGHSSNPTWSAYGSTSGNPRIVVGGIFALAGPAKFRGFVPGRVHRYYYEVTGSDLTTTGTNRRLYNLPRGYWLRSLLVKTGTKATGVTAGNNAYATLSDSILTEVRVMRGLNTVNRYYRSFHDLREDQVGCSSGLIVAAATGYGLIDWVKLGYDGELLDTRGLVAGPTGDVDLFFQADVAGASNQAALFAVEEWRHRPATLLR
jgi:hypothetical protein